MARLLHTSAFAFGRKFYFLIAILVVAVSLAGVLLPTYSVEANILLNALSPVSGVAEALFNWGASEVVEEAEELVQETGLSLLSYAMQLAAQVGMWLLNLVSQVLGSVVTIGSFVTNPIVASGWPFLQGLANFGFILALLVIAVTTALRVDIGGGARRLLPRLLLGAILINFSLLIGGLIIDVSRLLMALFANLAGSDVADLGPNIIQQSQLVQNVFTVVFDGRYLPVSFATNAQGAQLIDTGSITGVVRVAQATIFIWGLMIGMLVITVTLVIRYVWLLLLLIVSPLVYVAIAFPGAGGLARSWWSSFLRNVFYGPIAMFALVMLATVGSAQAENAGLENLGGAAQDFLTLVITVVALFVVATSGRQLGAKGASGAISGTKGVANWARRNPTKSAALIGTIATGGLGGAVLGALGVATAKSGVRNARDLGQTVKSNVAKNARDGKYGGVAKFVAGPERDEKGNLKKGQTSLGSALAEPKKSYKSIKESGLGKKVSKVIGSDGTKVAGAIPNAQDLSKPQVVAGISPDAYKAILNNTDPNAQQHKRELIAGTLQQDEISKEQVQTLNEHLIVTINKGRDEVRDAKNDEQQKKNVAREALQTYGATDNRTTTAQQVANDARDVREQAENRLKLAKGQLKEAVSKKQYVDELSQADQSKINGLQESDIETALRNTRTKKDSDKS